MLLRLLLLACCLLAAATVHAEADAGAQPAPEPETKTLPADVGPIADKKPSPAGRGGNSVTNPFVVLAGLAFIVLLIYGCAWLMRRIGAGNIGGTAGMKIIAGVAVGPREKVLLVEVGDQQVLIGVAPGRVSHLETFDQPVVSSAGGDTANFSERLKTMLSHHRGETP